jgi:hypothetical protein
MSATNETMPEFSVAYNFDRQLLEGLVELNNSDNAGVVGEVFGALPGSPVSSARPTARLPRVELDTFADQVDQLTTAGIGFNYLFNTNQRLNPESSRALSEYTKQLGGIGVAAFTAGNAGIAEVLREAQPDVHITMSITQGISTEQRLKEAEDSGVDAVYLDGVFVNRNFGLLRDLVSKATTDVRLYANMSCISGCQVVRSHYGVFAGEQTPQAAVRNDAFFAGCSAVKLKSPVEWLQMPWIRPEDIKAYVDEGASHFKLSDRLAPTDVILRIAGAYTSGVSPADMFEMIERDGAKMKALLPDKEDAGNPLTIDSSKLPDDFIDHFRSGDCISQDPSCPTCNQIASEAVTQNVSQADLDAITPVSLRATKVPSRLLDRIAE